jgi:arabinofuranosyltransferase
MSAPRKGTTVFTLIVLAYLLYAGIFIYQTSYLIDGQRYFVLFDDAMISMQYAKNLAHGHGLVWNAGGERVEGYTNPLWVLYMVLLHLLPLATSKVSLLVQITGALLLVANLFFVRKIADLISDGSAFVTTSAVLLTAFYLPLNNWALQGMEVGVLALIISSSLWQALRVLRS